jgi:hypothetical protein
MPSFDPAMTTGPHHPIAAGLPSDLPPVSITFIVRSAIERIPDAGWIDVEVQDFLPSCPGCGHRLSRGPSRAPARRA